jgi:hypothetical protein
MSLWWYCGVYVLLVWWGFCWCGWCIDFGSVVHGHGVVVVCRSCWLAVIVVICEWGCCLLPRMVEDIEVGGHGAGGHLFPFRTEPLSPATPMVLESYPGE